MSKRSMWWMLKKTREPIRPKLLERRKESSACGPPFCRPCPKCRTMLRRHSPLASQVLAEATHTAWTVRSWRQTKQERIPSEPHPHRHFVIHDACATWFIGWLRWPATTARSSWSCVGVVDCIRLYYVGMIDKSHLPSRLQRVQMRIRGGWRIAETANWVPQCAAEEAAAVSW